MASIFTAHGTTRLNPTHTSSSDPSFAPSQRQSPMIPSTLKIGPSTYPLQTSQVSSPKAMPSLARGSRMSLTQ
ncbi:hypothetical protein K439DRAFT_1642113 [Ramaria rubella]|nr:hypothetical protein K439DRAFT_1642113 [Ramaria rubella]